jgi:hypothetical protein
MRCIFESTLFVEFREFSELLWLGSARRKVKLTLVNNFVYIAWQILYNVRFEVFTAVTMKKTPFFKSYIFFSHQYNNINLNGCSV